MVLGRRGIQSEFVHGGRRLGSQLQSLLGGLPSALLCRENTITRRLAKRACGTNSDSSPFIRVVITSFKRGGAVNFVAVPTFRGGRAARQAPSPRRRPRRVCGGGGCLTLWVGVGASTRAQTRDGLRHLSSKISTGFLQHFRPNVGRCGLLL